MAETIGRPHRDRLLSDLNDIRTMLDNLVGEIPAAEMGFAPKPDMKSIRNILLEVGTMEKVCVHWASHQELPDWQAAWTAMDWGEADGKAAVAALAKVRAETLAYLTDCTEEKLETPIPLDPSWHGYFGAPTVEPEELIRWVIRHEYYHLGQLVIYRWMEGHST
jgi:uncharacterized damage-inducible protein DinB